jgi:hypothetical protein
VACHVMAVVCQTGCSQFKSDCSRFHVMCIIGGQRRMYSNRPRLDIIQYRHTTGVLGLCRTCSTRANQWLIVFLVSPSPSFVAPVAQDWGQRFDLRNAKRSNTVITIFGQLSTQTPAAASPAGATTATILGVWR